MTTPPILSNRFSLATPTGFAARRGLLARLAKSSRFIDHGLLAHLAELIEEPDDVQLAGDDIAIHLIEAGYCDARYASATAFTSALAARLRRYIDNPIAARAARGDFHERISWWGVAVSRAAKLSKWPAMVLIKNVSDA